MGTLIARHVRIVDKSKQRIFATSMRSFGGGHTQRRGGVTVSREDAMNQKSDRPVLALLLITNVISSKLAVHH
jgi:hypothetical protein